MKNAWRLVTAALAGVLAFVLAGFAFAAVEPPGEHSVKGAIVNLDEGVELEGQWVPMGRQLSAEMVLQDGPFEWEMSTPDLAQHGLSDGNYRVVVTIPKDFSQAVTSLASGGQVVQAHIDIEARPGADRDEALAVEQVTRAAAVALGGQISEEFVVALIGGLGDMSSQLGEAADGAGQLSDGTEELAAGTGALAEGTAALDDGLGQAATGFNELVGGVGLLADGANQAAGGIGALADGTGQLVGGVGQSAQGASELAGGTRGLAAGAGELATGMDAYVAGVGELSGGLAQYAQGVDMYAEGAQDFASGMDEYAQGVHVFADGVSEYTGGVSELVGLVLPGLDELVGVLTNLDSEMENAFEQLLSNEQFRAAIQGVADVANAVGQACIAAPGEGICAQLNLSPEELEYLANPELAQVLMYEIAQAAGDALSQISGNVEEVTAGVVELQGGLTQLDEGGKELAAGAQQLAAGTDVLSEEGARGLADGAEGLSEGIHALSDGAAALAQGGGQLAAGTTELAGGASQLADGTDLLADGLSTAARESGALVEGAYAAADGVDALAGGIGELEDGAGAAASGLGILSEGMHELAAGTSELDGGVGQLSDGSRELADGLGLAVDMIPTYTSEQAREMALGVTQPIEPPSVGGGVSARGASAFALLMWLASFVLASIYPVFSPRISRSVQPSWRLAASTWWKPAAWMAGIGAVIGFAFGNWIDTATGTVFALGGLGLLIGVVFVSVQQALAGALGMVGRVVSLAIFGVAAIAAATAGWGTPLEPLASVLPTGLASTALNAVAIPGLGSTEYGLVGLAFWMVGAYALAIWATASRRAKPADQLVSIAA